MFEMDDIFIKDRPEDVSWLCSLSESETDMLINLKSLILHRAKMMGHEELAQKFDLKVLRAIAFISMEYLRDQVKDSSVAPEMVKPAAFLDACNLLRCDHEGVMSVEDLGENIGVDPQRIVRGPQEEEEVSTKLKTRKRRKSSFVRHKRQKLKVESK